jgi:CheY-like chemotaxis protein
MIHRVLIVDDDEVIVRLAELTVRRLGYACAGFTQPEDAIAALSKAPMDYDVILCDVQLGSMSGFQVARELRRLSPRIPILMTSGTVTEADVARAREAGVVGILPKGDVMTDLKGTFERLVGCGHSG